MRGAAKQHKAIFERLVASSGQDVTVREPAARSTSTTAAEKVLGRPGTVPEAVGRVTTGKALVSTSYSFGAAMPGAGIPERIASIGRLERLDAVLRANLADWLVDPTHKLGKTFFDLAKDVVIDGEVFAVRVTDRTGLAPLGPYILWVAVVKRGE